MGLDRWKENLMPKSQMSNCVKSDAINQDRKYRKRNMMSRNKDFGLETCYSKCVCGPVALSASGSL